MENYYIISLQMIKYLCITSEEEYKKLVNQYLISNIESLKYISQTRSFNKIIKIAEELV